MSAARQIRRRYHRTNVEASFFVCVGPVTDVPGFEGETLFSGDASQLQTSVWPDSDVGCSLLKQRLVAHPRFLMDIDHVHDGIPK